MRPLDWIVLAATLLSIVLYGLWKGRGAKNIDGYLLANRSMKWYTIALSIMATQASAVTFISTPGQAYIDGMRFVQFYFGLPLAMIILSITAVPIFHKLKVYTAYEYIEKRFDAKMRVLTTAIFLASRGLAAGITIYAPALVLSVMLGMDIRITSLIIGGLVIIYTTYGGVKAVNYTDFFQFIIVMAGMCAAFIIAIRLLPSGISFADSLSISSAMGRLNTIDLSLRFDNRYNLWSGLIGGMFVALAYFGTDQSQVQRYLTGQSVRQSRIALLFNGAAKVPMQFFILFIGVMVFVLFQFMRPPILFNPVEREKIKTGTHALEFQKLEDEHNLLFQKKSDAIARYIQTKKINDAAGLKKEEEQLRDLQHRVDNLHTRAAELASVDEKLPASSDTNYIFLTFILTYLPVGFVGLLFACIFNASMSSSSGELSALATTSIIDIYKRFVRPSATDRHYLVASRILMTFWGIYGIAFAQFAGRMGSLVEAVNILGSLFYGTMLGIFLLAFYFKSVDGTAAFIGAIAGEITVIFCFLFSSIAWLWYNVVGCVVVVGVGVIVSMYKRGNFRRGADVQRE